MASKQAYACRLFDYNLADIKQDDKRKHHHHKPVKVKMMTDIFLLYFAIWHVIKASNVLIISN